MNIVVCVKYVPDATADRQFESDNTVDRVGVDGLLSELDEYAVEQALQLKEKAGDDTEVTALCIGPEKAVDAVRKALQMGADKGILVSDEAIAGSDYLGTSLVLFTTGFPGLSPMMGLTHGVHGLGDTVAVSVHAAESAVDDVDAYVERLARELNGPRAEGPAS
mgnify:CR=1 FL=1